MANEVKIMGSEVIIMANEVKIMGSEVIIMANEVEIMGSEVIIMAIKSIIMSIKPIRREHCFYPQSLRFIGGYSHSTLAGSAASHNPIGLNVSSPQ
jgi:hypothetical protein